jgi:hypothetical protein
MKEYKKEKNESRNRRCSWKMEYEKCLEERKQG